MNVFDKIKSSPNRSVILNISIFCTLFVLFTLYVKESRAAADVLHASHTQSTKEIAALKKYIFNVINNGYTLLNNTTLSEKERLEHARSMIKNNLYSTRMAQIALGHHRRILMKSKIADFTEIYKEYIIDVYTDLTKYYDGQKLVVTGIIPLQTNMFIVKTKVFMNDSQNTISVDYLVYKTQTQTNDTKYMIADIITENVSILQTQKDEFNKIIQNDGIDTLIQNLKQKIKS